MKLEELKTAGIVPTEELPVNLYTSYNFSKLNLRKLNTWVLRNPKEFHVDTFLLGAPQPKGKVQFLYFENDILVGWEEFNLDDNPDEKMYDGRWREWKRDYEPTVGSWRNN
jgi:hypothetical protein